MTQIKLRRDTSAAFASSNPILGNGEPAYETDTKKLKIGDGTTAYTQLEYFSAGGGGSGLEVCDIGMALYVDETKGLRRYLNGQIVDINTNTQAFLNRLLQITTLHPSLLCTEEEWQTAKTMSAFGQVGKFVFNYADDGVTVVSVRIPRVVNVQGLFDLQNLGMTVREKLPNIQGGVNGYIVANYASASDKAVTFTGAFKGVSTYVGTIQSGSNHFQSITNLSLDASEASSTYQNNAPVQQEAIQYPYFIQIATGSETENNIINEIELNNPYSLFDSKYSDHELNNLSWLKSSGQWNAKAVYPTAYNKLLKVQNGTETVAGLSVKLSTETYTDYDFVLNTANETFRLPLKTLYADNTVSGLSLYYYVGETVQNANLIDAGRIGEQLANKQDKLSRYPIAVSDKSLMPSWYVVYNDGWCEQGGRYKINTNGSGTITFLKEFVDTSYTIFNSKESSDPSSWNVMFDPSDTRTTSQVGIKANLTGYKLGGSWEAKGYIK